MRFDLRESIEAVDNMGNKLSKAQQKFFTNSDVVIGDTLMVKAHCSNSTSFNEFKTEFFGDSTFGYGFYFTDPDTLSTYFDDLEWDDDTDTCIDPRVKYYYLNIQNPWNWGQEEHTEIVLNYLKELPEIKNLDDNSHQKQRIKYWFENLEKASSDVSNIELIEDIFDDKVDQKKIYDWFIDMGFDGLHTWSEDYVAFYPNQIKLITNRKPTNSNRVDG